MLRTTTLNLVWGGLVALTFSTTVWSDPPTDAGQVSAPDASGVQPAPPPPVGMMRWFNPANAPFLPIPEIAQDPDSGTTLGVIPTWIKTDDERHIKQIIAPDIMHNPYFGWGVHGRIYSFPSEDEQWSIVTGIKQRVEREFDAEYEVGRMRQDRWSFTASAIYERDGTPRFYGIGNNSPKYDESNYTNQQSLGQVQIGYNFNHTWQLLYTGRLRSVDVQPGTLARIASLEARFGRILGVGINWEQLNRLSLVYDTRDAFTAPRDGMKWVLYAGLASRRGILNDSLYSELGIDGRSYLRLNEDTVLATHISLRYLPTAHRLPFWALSSIGGGESIVGGAQPLRGYGSGRFYDRNSFSYSAEIRRRVLSLDIASTHMDLEITPFVDLGQVFDRMGDWPIQKLHKVGGIGFRGIARPSVVGYVDIGYGNEGAAVFTGINYPF